MIILWFSLIEFLSLLLIDNDIHSLHYIASVLYYYYYLTVIYLVYCYKTFTLYCVFGVYYRNIGLLGYIP